MIKKINDIFNNIEKIFLFISKFGIIAIMLAISVDALSRYFFHSSIVGTYEVIEMYLMSMMVYMSMSYVMKIKGHIRLDILINKFSKNIQRNLNAFYYVFIAVWMLLIANLGMKSTLKAWTDNLVESGIVNLPLWPAYIWVSLGAYLMFIRLILLFINQFTTGYQKEDKY